MKRLKIAVYLNHAKDHENACTLYRNLTPLKYLGRRVKVRYIHSIRTEIDYVPAKQQVTGIRIDAEPVEWADLVVLCRHYDQKALMGTMTEIIMRLKKPFIYETDDLLHKVEDNLDENIMDDKVWTKVREAKNLISFMCEHAQCITVTTPYLAKYYADHYGKKVFVLPNCYDPKMWRFLYWYRKLRMFWRRKIKRDKSFRVGWQGGNNHLIKNLAYIVGPITELKKKYGDKLTFVYMGGDPRVGIYGSKQKFLDVDFEYRTPTKTVWSFPRALAEMDLDLGLIVVEDNDFSRAKSNIKWMEYSLLGIPSIASDVEPYKKTNAVLVDNTSKSWVNAIEDFLQNPEKCGKIGIEARKLAKQFNIKKHAHKWLTAFQYAIDTHRTEIKNRKKVDRFVLS